jgi:Ca2+-binding RTX toxin-like protein
MRRKLRPSIRRTVLCLLAGSLIASAAYAHSPRYHVQSRDPHCLGHRATIVGPNDPNDTPPGTGNGPRLAIIGTPHADVIVGTRAAEWIVGNGGADVICARAGRDVVFVGWGDTHADKRGHVDAGRGDDYVEGSFKADVLDLGAGDDMVDGEFGADVIRAGPGDDFIRTQVGNDRVFGELGADHVETSSGNDFVDGGSGDDYVSTGSGRDVTRGGGGDDSMHLLTGNDRGYGGRGNDFVGGFDGRDLLDGGPGADVCSGGHDRDRYVGCERRKERSGPKPPSPPHIKLPPYRSKHPEQDQRAFRRFLQRLDMVETNRRLGWIIARFHQLRRAANVAVKAHWRQALKDGVPPRRAALRRSVDYLGVRRVQTAISDEIDRLRIAFHQQRPPDTTITSDTSGATNDPTPTFTFSSTAAGSGFQCKIDSGSFAPCHSPFTTKHLTDGAHAFYVRATGPWGNPDPTPDSRSFTVSTAAVSVAGSTLVVSAASGATDNLAITRTSTSELRITDSPSGSYAGSGVHVGPGCTRSGDYTANCAGEIVRVRIKAGDKTDQVVNSTGVPSSLYGGTGKDMLTGGWRSDTLIGGPSADVMNGMKGNDLLRTRDRTSDELINCDGGIGTPGHADKADLDKLPKDPNSVVKGCERKTRH